MSLRPACVYLPLECVSSRYTAALCNPVDGWMPDALRSLKWRRFTHIDPIIQKNPSDIKVGAVLDAVGRGRYSLEQISRVLVMLQEGLLRDGDVIYLQDFWTPGLEALFYAMHLYGIKLRIYAMCHAQSVDPHDFTAPMTPWIRGIELSYAQQMAGIFVASTCHRDELKEAGITTPIHVVGLPFGLPMFTKQYDHLNDLPKRNIVVYTSRIDKEKQPEFMMEVARKFLAQHKDWEWHVTTSSEKFRSYNNEEVIPKLRNFAQKNSRFKIYEGLSKVAYYTRLAESAIQFNCSLQDYVSWTYIESCFFGCSHVYPRYRSFPECVWDDCLYKPFIVEDALTVLHRRTQAPRHRFEIPRIMDEGRKAAAMIAYTPELGAQEYNVWQK